MKVPFYSSTREYHIKKNEFDNAIMNVLEKGDFILGTEVTKFEEEATLFLGAKYAVGVASGSDALVLGADILGFKDGAEIITPTYTFFASTSCVARLGGKPIFVDLDENTLNMNICDIENKISKKTRGIIPVHLFVQATPMQAIMDLAKEHGISVLEDAAEAWGMMCLVNKKWQMAGTIGDIGTYSFFPTKTLGAYGDAGLMVTNDEVLYEKIKSYRIHGTTKKYHHDYIGYNSRLDTIQAAILRVKLSYTQQSISARNKHAEHYKQRLKSVKQVKFQRINEENKAVYYVFNIFANKRDKLAEFLRDNGVATTIYYPKPLHLQKCFSYLGHKPGDFPVAEKVASEILALPIFPEISNDEVDYVCDMVEKFYK
jgi:dTDP-4-amino-4,6-dideoxygalactose transaminase